MSFIMSHLNNLCDLWYSCAMALQGGLNACARALQENRHFGCVKKQNEKIGTKRCFSKYAVLWPSGEA
jgi:hypothetical protein